MITIIITFSILLIISWIKRLKKFGSIKNVWNNSKQILDKENPTIGDFAFLIGNIFALLGLLLLIIHIFP